MIRNIVKYVTDIVISLPLFPSCKFNVTNTNIYESTQRTFSDDETTPYVPSSPKIKLVDLNSACFIPVAMPAHQRSGYEDYKELETDPSTQSPLVASSMFLKKQAKHREVSSVGVCCHILP